MMKPTDILHRFVRFLQLLYLYVLVFFVSNIQKKKNVPITKIGTCKKILTWQRGATGAVAPLGLATGSSVPKTDIGPNAFCFSGRAVGRWPGWTPAAAAAAAQQDATAGVVQASGCGKGRGGSGKGGRGPETGGHCRPETGRHYRPETGRRSGRCRKEVETDEDHDTTGRRRAGHATRAAAQVPGARRAEERVLGHGGAGEPGQQVR